MNKQLFPSGPSDAVLVGDLGQRDVIYNNTPARNASPLPTIACEHPTRPAISR